MNGTGSKATGVVGAIFLAVAVIEFLQDDQWVVWAILGVLLGGLGFLRRR